MRIDRTDSTKRAGHSPWVDVLTLDTVIDHHRGAVSGCLKGPLLGSVHPFATHEMPAVGKPPERTAAFVTSLGPRGHRRMAAGDSGKAPSASHPKRIDHCKGCLQGSPSHTRATQLSEASHRTELKEVAELPIGLSRHAPISLGCRRVKPMDQDAHRTAESKAVKQRQMLIS